MEKNQVVTLSFLNYSGWKNRWWAFQQMGLGYQRIEGVKGLQFVKLLGSGGKRGFSLLPNFGSYGFLAIWDNLAQAKRFFKEHAFAQELRGRSTEMWTVFMRTVMAHGAWSGKAPFQVSKAYDDKMLIGVITRATIRPRYLVKFWSKVPRVSRSIEHKPGLLFSIGIGEWPIVQQATFSLWKNGEAMKAYAYRSKLHQEVIRKTRELGWYKEELFARFAPFASSGTWQGKNPLEGFLEK